MLPIPDTLTDNRIYSANQLVSSKKHKLCHAMSKIGRFGIFSDVKFGSQLELKDCTFESVNYAEI